MKVTQPKPSTDGATESNKATAARGGARAASASADEAAGAPGEVPGRDFASVLEEVSRADERRDSETEGDRRDLKQPEKGKHEAVERREQERRGGDGEASGGGSGRTLGSVREVISPTEAPGARAILHIADLERIVSAVRTQLLPGGMHEVTVELRRSTLEGLLVKVRSSGDGRVTAEFIAASERVRAQVEARLPELAELMRGRGINLASLNTSTASADTSGGNQTGRGSSQPKGGVNPSAVPRVGDGPSANAEAGGAVETDGTGTTYRA
ncbi:MAG TPA: flagellar hook-length control protein FliK [Pyrinomonadaceae bacterium]